MGTEGGSLVVAIIAAAIALISAFFSWLQRRTAQEQVRIAKEQSASAKASADAARLSAETAEENFELAKSQWNKQLEWKEDEERDKAVRTSQDLLGLIEPVILHGRALAEPTKNSESADPILLNKYLVTRTEWADRHGRELTFLASYPVFKPLSGAHHAFVEFEDEAEVFFNPGSYDYVADDGTRSRIRFAWTKAEKKFEDLRESHAEWEVQTSAYSRKSISNRVIAERKSRT